MTILQVVPDMVFFPHLFLLCISSCGDLFTFMNANTGKGIELKLPVKEPFSGAWLLKRLTWVLCFAFIQTKLKPIRYAIQT